MIDDPGLAFMRREHPDKLAARDTPHAFVPMPLYPQDPPDHVCKGHCVCETCWEWFSARVHKGTARPRP